MSVFGGAAAQGGSFFGGGGGGGGAFQGNSGPRFPRNGGGGGGGNGRRGNSPNFTGRGSGGGDNGGRGSSRGQRQRSPRQQQQQQQRFGGNKNNNNSGNNNYNNNNAGNNRNNSRRGGRGSSGGDFGQSNSFSDNFNGNYNNNRMNNGNRNFNYNSNNNNNNQRNRNDNSRNRGDDNGGWQNPNDSNSSFNNQNRKRERGGRGMQNNDPDAGSSGMWLQPRQKTEKNQNRSILHDAPSFPGGNFSNNRNNTNHHNNINNNNNNINNSVFGSFNNSGNTFSNSVFGASANASSHSVFGSNGAFSRHDATPSFNNSAQNYSKEDHGNDDDDNDGPAAGTARDRRDGAVGGSAAGRFHRSNDPYDGNDNDNDGSYGRSGSDGAASYYSDGGAGDDDGSDAHTSAQRDDRWARSGDSDADDDGSGYGDDDEGGNDDGGSDNYSGYGDDEEAAGGDGGSGSGGDSDNQRDGSDDGYYNDDDFYNAGGDDTDDTAGGNAAPKPPRDSPHPLPSLSSATPALAAASFPSTTGFNASSNTGGLKNSSLPSAFGASATGGAFAQPSVGASALGAATSQSKPSNLSSAAATTPFSTAAATLHTHTPSSAMPSASQPTLSMPPPRPAPPPAELAIPDLPATASNDSSSDNAPNASAGGDRVVVTLFRSFVNRLVAYNSLRGAADAAHERKMAYEIEEALFGVAVGRAGTYADMQQALAALESAWRDVPRGGYPEASVRAAWTAVFAVGAHLNLVVRCVQAADNDEDGTEEAERQSRPAGVPEDLWRFRAAVAAHPVEALHSACMAAGQLHALALHIFCQSPRDDTGGFLPFAALPVILDRVRIVFDEAEARGVCGCRRPRNGKLYSAVRSQLNHVCGGGGEDQGATTGGVLALQSPYHVQMALALAAVVAEQLLAGEASADVLAYAALVHRSVPHAYAERAALCHAEASVILGNSLDAAETRRAADLLRTAVALTELLLQQAAQGQGQGQGQGQAAATATAAVQETQRLYRVKLLCAELALGREHTSVAAEIERLRLEPLADLVVALRATSLKLLRRALRRHAVFFAHCGVLNVLSTVLHERLALGALVRFYVTRRCTKTIDLEELRRSGCLADALEEDGDWSEGLGGAAPEETVPTDGATPPNVPPAPLTRQQVGARDLLTTVLLPLFSKGLINGVVEGDQLVLNPREPFTGYTAALLGNA